MIALVLVGLATAPLLNVLIDRLPRRQHLLARPACQVCGTERSWRSLVPASDVLFGFRPCSGCGTRPAYRPTVVTMALLVAAVAVWFRDESGLSMYLHLLLCAYFLAIVAIDLEHRLVLNRMTGAGLVAAFGIAIAGLGPTLPHAVIGTGVGFLFLFIPALVLPGLGMGDVKLAAVIGALVGYPAVLTALTAGVLAGGVAAGVLLVTRRIGRRSTLAYAPYLVFGVGLVLFGLIGSA